MSYAKYEEHLQMAMRDRALMNADFSKLREMNSELASVLAELERDFKVGEACIHDMLEGIRFAVQRLRGGATPKPARLKRK
ncbi:MAG: hypothetical protein JWM36_1126 [Hyphomicrobiales bacterium]|nr:hypothetical protein [Hyphomicrobiales bacterium]